METTEVTLEWMMTITLSGGDMPESFIASCFPEPSPYDALHNTSVTSPIHEWQDNTNYTLLVTGLQEYTHYTCSITPRNIFGEGPAANISILTNPAGIETPKVTDKL